MRDTTLAEWLADDDDDLPPAAAGRAPRRESRRGADPHGETPRRQPFRRRLWLIAGVAWALVAAVWTTALSGSPGGAGDYAGEAAAGADAGEAAAGAGAGEGEPAAGAGAGEAGAGAGAGAAAPGAGAPAGHGSFDVEVAAAAVLGVRLALTQHDEHDGSARYVDLAVPVRVDWHGDTAFVTVDAVVYDGDPEGWGPSRAVRYAQPVRRTAAGPLPAGRPWPVPAPAGDGAGVGLLPVDEPGAAQQAEDALAAAGYREIEVREVLRPEGISGILVADIEARAPGEPGRAAHQVWISEEATAVLGAADPSSPAEPQRQGES